MKALIGAFVGATLGARRLRSCFTLTAWWSRFWWISIFPFLLSGLLGVLIQPRVAFGQFDEQVAEIWGANEDQANPGVEVKGAELRRRLASGDWGEPDDYMGMARVNWATVPTTMVADHAALAWHHPEPTPHGWQRFEDLVIHSQDDGRDFSPYTLTLPAPAFNQDWAGLNDYDALWVDYRLNPGAAACGLSMSLKGQASPWGGGEAPDTLSWVASYGDGRALAEQAVDVAADRVWVQKDYRYLLSRMLGLEPDEAWRTAQDGDHTVVQRRLHWPVTDGAVLHLELAPGTQVGGINLFLRPDDTLRDGDLVQVAGVAPGPLPGGGYGVSIDLDQVAAQRYPRTQAEAGPKAWLNEVFLFLPGQESVLSQAKPVRRLALLTPAVGVSHEYAATHHTEKSQPNPADKITTNDSVGSIQAVAQGSGAASGSLPPSRLVNLSGLVEDQGQGWQRLMMDLSPLSELGKLSWGGGEIRLKPSTPGAACVLQIGAVQLVALYQAQAPTWIQEVNSWGRAWGGAWPPGMSDMNQVPAVRVLADESLHLMQPLNPTQASTDEVLVRIDQQGKATVSEPRRLSGMPPAWVVDAPPVKTGEEWINASGRVRLRATVGGVDQNDVTAKKELDEKARAPGFVAIKDGRGAVVIGNQISFVLEWALATELPPGTRLLIGHWGSMEQVARVRLRLIGPADESFEQWVTPGQATPVADGAPRRVARAELTFEMAQVPFEVTMGHLTLLIPERMQRRDALTAPFPWQGVQALDMHLADEAVVLDDREGRGRGYWPAGVDKALVEASARIPVQVIERLGLSWELPLDWLIPDGCLLEGEFVFQAGRVTRRFCLSRAAGARDFFANELRLLELPNFGKLERIHWKVHKPIGAAGVMNLQTVLHGRDLFSYWDRLIQQPIAHVADKQVLPDPSAWAEALEAAAERRAFKVELPAWATAALIADQPSLQASETTLIRQPEDPAIKLERITLSPKEPMNWQQWASLVAPLPKPAGSSLWSKLLTPLLVLGLVALVWWLGWWPRMWATTMAILKGVAWRLPRAVIAWLWRWVMRRVAWLNRLVGVLVVPGLVFLSGQAGPGLRGYSLVLAALILAINVFRFWQKSRSASGPLGVPSWTSPEAGMLGLAMLVSLWALGYRGHDPAALWAVLLLPVAIYGYLPALVALTEHLFRHFHAAAWAGLWTLVTLGLYLGGQLRPAAAGSENYFFTFGGMAGLTAAWYLLNSLRGTMVARWPGMAGNVYRSAGSRFFSIALVLLIITALVLAIGLEPLAEQVAVIVYYALVAGTFREVLALRREVADERGANKTAISDGDEEDPAKPTRGSDEPESPEKAIGMVSPS